MSKLLNTFVFGHGHYGLGSVPNTQQGGRTFEKTKKNS